MAPEDSSGGALPKRELGKTGLRVSEISLGTSVFGGLRYGAALQHDSIACLERYLNVGGNFIDTARKYGDSENIIGEVLSAHGARSTVVLATKTTGNDRKAIETDLAASLHALRSEYVEVYYLHRAPKKHVSMPYRSLPEVAIRFVLDEPGIATAVIGARTAEQIDSGVRPSGLPSLPPRLRALILDRYARRGHHFNLRRPWDRWMRLPRRLVKKLR